ncbi:MAG: DUF4920 domain-containing protein [Deltaproteobacteria bacterium]|nr:DUF4920 domain-containing protein [Deltaproteobacteria bacterium]
MFALSVSFTCALLACTPSDPPAQSAAPAAPSGLAAAPKAKGQSFGKAIDEATPYVALADILKDPKAWSGKKVRTRGEVVAVCQNAGCWCDLRPEGATAGLVPTHVTMHGHAFFLPKTAKSKVAEVEGNLVVRELSQGEVEHFNSEGASLTAGTPVVNVDALGVTLL